MRLCGQTESMRRMAGKDKYIGADKDEKGWFGVELVSHPMPGGTGRLMMTYSDNRRWPTKEVAIRVMEIDMKKLDEDYLKWDAEDAAMADALKAEELTRG